MFEFRNGEKQSIFEKLFKRSNSFRTALDDKRCSILKNILAFLRFFPNLTCRCILFYAPLFNQASTTVNYPSLLREKADLASMVTRRQSELCTISNAKKTWQESEKSRPTDIVFLNNTISELGRGYCCPKRTVL